MSVEPLPEAVPFTVRTGGAIQTSRASAPRRVRVLELDPDLGNLLDDDDRRHAEATCLGTQHQVEAGPWAPSPELTGGRSVFAFVVTEGILGREVSLGSRSMVELLVAGDLSLLAPAGPDPGLLSTSVSFTAVTPVTVMVLARSFVKAAGRWPGLLIAAQQRIALQHAALAGQNLALHLPQARDRVLLTLWLLAERCGRVTTAGLLLPLEIPHAALSRIVAARRPTVSLAITALKSAGAIRADTAGGIVLTDEAERHLKALALQEPALTSVAASFRFGARPVRPARVDGATSGDGAPPA